MLREFAASAARVCLALSLCCVMPSSNGDAQTSSPAPSISPASVPPASAQPSSAERTPLAFDSHIVVTGTRSETDPARAVVSTTVVNEAEMRLRNVPTVDKALDLTPGLYIFRTRGVPDIGTRVSLRGFNGASRSLVLLDGQPLNDAYTGDVTWTSLPLGEIERVEVVRGPFSALYGGNAMGGVINVLTKPIAARALSASAQAGTYGTRQGSVHYADRLGAFAFSAGYQRLQADGYEPRPITVIPGAAGTGTRVTGATLTRSSTGAPAFIVGSAGENRYDQDASRIKGEWTPDARTSLSAHYVYQRSAYGYDDPSSTLRDADGRIVDRGAVLIDDGSGVLQRATLTPGTFLQGPGDDGSHLVGGRLHRLIGGSHALSASFSLYRQPSSTTRTPTAATATWTGGPGTTAVRDSRSTFVNAQDEWALGRHTLSAGVDFRREQSDNREFLLSDWTSETSRLSPSFESFGRARSLAAYVQDRVTLGDRLTLLAGGRVDHWRTDDGVVDIFNAALPRTAYAPRSAASVTGKLSAAFRPSAAWTLRGSVGTAFRNPTVFELYRTFRLSTGTLFAANPDLQPERLTSGEIGITRQFGTGTARGRGSIEATWYRNAITDLIYRTTDLAADPTGRYRVLVNAGEGTTNGLELAASQRLAAWLLIRGAYTYTDAIIARNPALPETEGKRVPNVPEHTGSLALFAARGRVSGSLDARYVSGTFGLDTNLDTTKGVVGSYSPFFVMGGSLSLDLGHGVAAFASVDNLLDRQYYVFYLNPGRTVSAGVRVSLGGGTRP